MNAIRNAPLKALPEFKLLSPAISKEEYDALEKKMVASKKKSQLKSGKISFFLNLTNMRSALKTG